MLVFEHQLVLLKAQRFSFSHKRFPSYQSTSLNSPPCSCNHFQNWNIFPVNLCEIGKRTTNNCKTSRAFLSTTTLSMLDTTPHADPLKSRAVEPKVLSFFAMQHTAMMWMFSRQNRNTCGFQIMTMRHFGLEGSFSAQKTIRITVDRS